jgi:hypothetical protein
MEQIFENHPELLKIIQSGDRNELIKFLTNNHDIATEVLNYIASLKD